MTDLTNLEITLIAIIWVVYGIFAAYQTKENKDMYSSLEEDANRYPLYITFAPIVLIVKAIHGIFKKYKL